MYLNEIIKPEIIITENTFTMILPNKNANKNKKTIDNTSVETTTLQEIQFVNYIKEYGSATQEEIQEVLNVKKTRAYIIAKSLCDKGIIKAVGRGKDKRYYIA